MKLMILLALSTCVVATALADAEPGYYRTGRGFRRSYRTGIKSYHGGFPGSARRRYSGSSDFYGLGADANPFKYGSYRRHRGPGYAAARGVVTSYREPSVLQKKLYGAAAYAGPTPVVHEKAYVRPAAVVRKAYVAPAPVVEEAYIAPAPVVHEKAYVAPPVVHEKAYVAPAPVVHEKAYVAPPVVHEKAYVAPAPAPVVVEEVTLPVAPGVVRTSSRHDTHGIDHSEHHELHTEHGPGHAAQTRTHTALAPGHRSHTVEHTSHGVDHRTHETHHRVEEHVVPVEPVVAVVEEVVPPAVEVRRVIDRPHPHVKTVYNRHIKPRTYPVHPTLQYGPAVYDK